MGFRYERTLHSLWLACLPKTAGKRDGPRRGGYRGVEKPRNKARGLAHLYVFCKGGDGEVGPDSFSLKRAQRESTSSEAKAPGALRPKGTCSRWLAHLYVFCKGGNGKVGRHNVSLSVRVSWLGVQPSPSGTTAAMTCISSPAVVIIGNVGWRARSGGICFWPCLKKSASVMVSWL